MNNQSNDETNFLLLLILLALTGGAGAVTGFFSAIFWIVLILAILIGLIWFFTKFWPVILIIGILVIAAMIFKPQPSVTNYSQNQQQNNNQPVSNITSAPNIDEYGWPLSAVDSIVTNCINVKSNNLNKSVACRCIARYIESKLTYSDYSQMENTFTQNKLEPSPIYRQTIKNAAAACDFKIP